MEGIGRRSDINRHMERDDRSLHINNIAVLFHHNINIYLHFYVFILLFDCVCIYDNYAIVIHHLGQ